ncbi:MAG: PHP domain-containing protein [Phycisphaerae bacterium]|nr:PHP domain-containing protein [Gemmatimonadaceae bacterium]
MTTPPPGVPFGANPELRGERQGPFVDLQTHTTASDGALPPTTVVEAAKAAELAAIAITDHDTVDGLDEANIAGARLGVRIVPGVELSSNFEGEEMHMLGLHMRDLDVMATALSSFRVGRVDRSEQIVAILNRAGIPVTMEAVLRHADGGAVGRPHIARAMVDGGWVHEFREAFDKWIGAGKPAYVPKEQFAASDAIALVHRAGGITVWAHPGELATPARVGRLAALGLDAVEVLHPSHPPYVQNKILNAVNELGLLPSGGSDWHGTTDGYRRLGGQQVPMEWLVRQDALVASRFAVSTGH